MKPSTGGWIWGTKNYVVASSSFYSHQWDLTGLMVMILKQNMTKTVTD